MIRKITVELDPEVVDDIIRDRLRENYIDNATVWKNEQGSKKLGKAFKRVIEHYSAPDEFANWWDTVKDL